MREILFRGKRLDNGEWKEGYVFDDGLLESKRKFIGCIIIEDDPDQIHGTDYYEVDTNTVSQYIGLTDKNGKKIFEGDIVKVLYHDDWWEDKNKTQFVENIVIEYHPQYGDLIGRRKKSHPFSTCSLSLYVQPNEDAIRYYLEVIGNKWDNPELLKESEER